MQQFPRLSVKWLWCLRTLATFIEGQRFQAALQLSNLMFSRITHRENIIIVVIIIQKSTVESKKIFKNVWDDNKRESLNWIVLSVCNPWITHTHATVLWVVTLVEVRRLSEAAVIRLAATTADQRQTEIWSSACSDSIRTMLINEEKRMWEKKKSGNLVGVERIETQRAANVKGNVEIW